MNFSDRLNHAMKTRNVTQAQLGEAVGISQTSIWKLTTGIAKTSRKILEISKYLGVDAEWLAHGVGESGLVNGEQLISQSNNKKDGVPMSEMKEVDEWDGNTPLSNDEVEVPYYKSIELAAGHGCSSNEDYNGYKLRFGKSFFRRKGVQKEFVACFPASGNSMEPFIPHGSVVAVDTSRKDIIDGDIYAICQDGLCRIKRLYALPNYQVRINSYNTEEHPDEITNLKEIQIIGRVFYYSVEL